jgi:uncharacterized protein YbjQ (UPF0145 family)
MTDDRDVGLPEAARTRLEDVRRRGQGFFTSDLSVNEFLLAREAGFEPVTQVMGSSVYHVGWQQMPYASSWSFWEGGSSELDVLTEAWNEARRLAVGRLVEEAKLAGADAVVGVRLTRKRFDVTGDLVEFMAFGTAVRSTRYDLGDETVVSNLSGQEFAKLFMNRYWPVGLVADTSVTYVVAGYQSRQAQQGFLGRTAQGGSAFSQNMELTDYTQGFYDARANAMRRLQRQAHELSAHGVVGVQFDQHHDEREVDQNGARTDLIVSIHVLGTAIVELAADELPPTYIAVSL